MGKVRFYFKIFGDVQGVGFRYHLRGTAKALGLSGWVRNEGDGTVQGEVEGEADAALKFLREAGRGSYFRRVEKIEKKREEFKSEFKDFEIKSV